MVRCQHTSQTISSNNVQLAQQASLAKTTAAFIVCVLDLSPLIMPSVQYENKQR